MSRPERRHESNSARQPVGRNVFVGIGASAGGIEALKELFLAMPSDRGMAFVVIQHLEPTRESRMADILGKCASMKIVQAEDGMPVHADRGYANPAGEYSPVNAGRTRGSQGRRLVHGAGPQTAQFPAMPQNVIDTGLVDHVLPVAQMPAALVSYAQHHQEPSWHGYAGQHPRTRFRVPNDPAR